MRTPYFNNVKTKAFRAITILALLLAALSAHYAHAGVMEVAYSFSQRSSFIDDDNFQKSLSHTASLAWYFFEMSALELSYTKGDGEVSGKSSTDPQAIRLITKLEMYDASLVITFAQKDWSFQPYIKGGAAWVDKKIYRDDAQGYNKISQTDKDDVVPSFGVGFKLFLTKTLSLRAGYDRWRTGKNGEEETWDEAIRAGLSLMF